MSENIGERRLNFCLEYFREKFSLLCPIFLDMKLFIFGLAFVLYVLGLSGSNGS